MDNKLKHIAAINDLSCFGKCSLTVALPIISAAGVECACIPTALLSTHTAPCFKGWTFRDLTDEMLPTARHWHELGLHFDGIYSGYLASPQQGEIVREIVSLLRADDTKLIIDPAMADNGRYYANFDDRMAECFRKLIDGADLIKPNYTEACFLTGETYTDAPHDEAQLMRILDKLTDMGAKSVVITGVSLEPGRIGVIARDENGRISTHMSDFVPGLYHGSGDVFGSALAALVVRGFALDRAVAAAEDFTAKSVRATYEHNGSGHYGLDFESALDAIIGL